MIRAGIAYKFVEGDQGEGVPVGLLNATQAVVFNTSDTLREREMKVFGDPLETLWKNCIFGLCGVEAFHRKNYGVMVTSTIDEREIGWRVLEQPSTHYFRSGNLYRKGTINYI